MNGKGTGGEDVVCESEEGGRKLRGERELSGGFLDLGGVV